MATLSQLLILHPRKLVRCIVLAMEKMHGHIAMTLEKYCVLELEKWRWRTTRLKIVNNARHLDVITSNWRKTNQQQKTPEIKLLEVQFLTTRYFIAHYCFH